MTEHVWNTFWANLPVVWLAEHTDNGIIQKPIEPFSTYTRANDDVGRVDNCDSIVVTNVEAFQTSIFVVKLQRFLKAADSNFQKPCCPVLSNCHAIEINTNRVQIQLLKASIAQTHKRTRHPRRRGDILAPSLYLNSEFAFVDWPE